MDPRIGPLTEILQLNTRLIRNSQRICRRSWPVTCIFLGVLDHALELER